MTTFGDLIERTKQYLYSGHRVARNRLTSDVGVSDDTLTFDFPLGEVSEGSRITIGLESMWVWEINPTERTVTVERGFEGTGVTSHAAGVIAEVDAPFPTPWVAHAINEDLSDLSSPSNGLFAVDSVDFTYQASIDTYSIDGSVMLDQPLDVRYEARGADRSWPRVPRYQLLREMPSVNFADEAAIFLPCGGPDQGATVRVWFKTAFGALSDLDDDVEQVSGLRERAHDIPPLGAAWRLLSGRPVKRSLTETQGDTRRAAEVTAAEVRAAPANLFQLRSERVAAEAGQLTREWPRVVRR